MILEIVIDNRVKKKHYLKSDDDFYINWILSSYGEKLIPVLREKIKDLLIKLTSPENCERSAETLAIIDGILYNIKLTKWSENSDTSQPDTDSSNDLPSGLYDSLKERAYEVFRLYTKYDLY